MVSLILVVLLVSYVYNVQQVPVDVAGVYTDFLNAFSYGNYEDIDAFLHYELPEYRAMNETHFQSIQQYEIRRWEKLNDHLWAATTYYQLEQESEGSICYHFVGEIDGGWKVMLGPHNVPDTLANGADLSRFVPPNALPVDTEIVGIP